MRPRAFLLTIGNEILKGSVLNTNAQFLGRELTSLGFEVLEQRACRDEMQEILDSISGALQVSDLLILTGGLGPTPDDLTRDAVAAYYQVPLEFSRKQYAFIERYYQKRKKKVPAIVRKEAMFPANSQPLFNQFGIALGFSIVEQGKLMVVLPGVPMEMQKMYGTLVKPLILKCFKKIPKRQRLIVKTVGLSEPDVMKKIGKDFFAEKFDFGIYPSLGEVALRMYTDSPKTVIALRRKVQERMGGSVYAYEERTLAETVGDILQRKKWSLAAAESCTGGLLASQITQVPGAGKYFRGSVTAYQIQAKRWLGVSEKVLKEKSLVSPEVAKELAITIRKNFDTDFGIGITGGAGPTKESGAPVGLVYLAIAGPKKVRVWKENFLGDRNQIQAKAVKKVLEYLWKWIR